MREASAVLRGPKGEVLKPVLLWQPEPILPAAPGDVGKRGRVVVEVLATEKDARGTYTLILWDALSAQGPGSTKAWG
ncbi:DUF2381 family protein [Archangium violaceum]|uniref:hypothetical protein n=1 Tax=Archangium violaceum TaxID=83451 RepID=UPI002B2A612B|nr:DUF2381 family protein [Archangium violaceum]